MNYDEACIYAQKDPRFLFEKRTGGNPGYSWSLLSTIDGSTVWKNSYVEHKVTGKTRAQQIECPDARDNQKIGLGNQILKASYPVGNQGFCHTIILTKLYFVFLPRFSHTMTFPRIISKYLSHHTCLNRL